MKHVKGDGIEEVLHYDSEHGALGAGVVHPSHGYGASLHGIHCLQCCLCPLEEQQRAQSMPTFPFMPTDHLGDQHARNLGLYCCFCLLNCSTPPPFPHPQPLMHWKESGLRAHHLVWRVVSLQLLVVGVLHENGVVTDDWRD